MLLLTSTKTITVTKTNRAAVLFHLESSPTVWVVPPSPGFDLSGQLLI